MPDAPTPVSPTATSAEERRPSRAVAVTTHRTSYPAAPTSSVEGGGSMNTVGVYERPRGIGRLSGRALVVLLILIIISVITFLRFLF